MHDFIEEPETERQKRTFGRVTWEDIYNFILSTKETSYETKAILDYFRHKTIGYASNGILQRAFSIQTQTDPKQRSNCEKIYKGMNEDDSLS